MSGSPLILAVDASLGEPRQVGSVAIGLGPLQPGAGVNKSLPCVGHAFLTGTVNVGGFMEYMVLQSTRLCLVFQMASIIARAILLSVPVYLASKNHGLAEPG